MIIKGSSLRNDTGGISGKQGIEVAVGGSLTNNIGVISSEEGDISLLANSVDNHGGFMMGQNITMESMSGVNNNTALIVASKKLKINARGSIENRDGNNFGNAYGLYFGMLSKRVEWSARKASSFPGRTSITTTAVLSLRMVL